MKFSIAIWFCLLFPIAIFSCTEKPITNKPISNGSEKMEESSGVVLFKSAGDVAASKATLAIGPDGKNIKEYLLSNTGIIALDRSNDLEIDSLKYSDLQKKMFIGKRILSDENSKTFLVYHPVFFGTEENGICVKIPYELYSIGNLKLIYSGEINKVSKEIANKNNVALLKYKVIQNVLNVSLIIKNEGNIFSEKIQL